MIHAIELENFKGIAARQRVDFSPLTLLFGPNSAGKSTVLQALIYLHELLERGTADVDRTELGGSVLELGGFARLVHRHERDRAIILRVEFTTPASLERFGRDLIDFPFPDLDDEVEAAWIEVTIQQRTTQAFQGSMIERAAIGVAGNSEPLVWLETVGALREGEPLYCRINLGHSLIAIQGSELSDAWTALSVPEPIWHRAAEADLEGQARIGLDDLLDFQDGRALPLIALGRTRFSALPPIGEPLHVISEGDDSAEKRAVIAQIRTFVEMVVLGTTTQLALFLRSALYVGPLRVIPPRGFLYERTGRITTWADGLAAWDLLLADRGSIVDRTNQWLRRLEAGCEVVVQQLFDREADAEELSEGHVDKTVRRLLLNTGASALVLPSEVGAGISQIIPVLVAALEGSAALCLVEQPEIHVHPAIQVGLGDLFIDAATRDGGRRTMLIETHSEHLLLRLLRRIRETTEKEIREGDPALAPEKLSVLYVESDPDGVRVHRLRVDDRGEFQDRWPKGFFSERMKELL